MAAVSGFLHDLQPPGRTPATQRSDALDVLPWFRFLGRSTWGALRATRCGGRDFSRWLALVDKPRQAGIRDRSSIGSYGDRPGRVPAEMPYSAVREALADDLLFAVVDVRFDEGPPLVLIR